MGCLALGYCAFLWGRAEYDQAEGKWALEHILPGDRTTVAGPSSRPPDSAEGSLVGRIDIPRLDLSVVVFEGTSDQTLARGVGHLRGSAGLGERGNLVLAGHRDTFFRPLRGITQGDPIRVKTPGGSFQYIVDSIQVVAPQHSLAFETVPAKSITLITCFPFDYVGPAPRRFVVRARMADSGLVPSVHKDSVESQPVERKQ